MTPCDTMASRTIEAVLLQLDHGIISLKVACQTVSRLVKASSQVAFGLHDDTTLHDYIASLFDSYEAGAIDRRFLLSDVRDMLSAFETGDPYALDLIRVAAE